MQARVYTQYRIPQEVKEMLFSAGVNPRTGELNPEVFSKVLEDIPRDYFIKLPSRGTEEDHRRLVKSLTDIGFPIGDMWGDSEYWHSTTTRKGENVFCIYRNGGLED